MSAIDERASDRAAGLLEGLNPAQREAVTAGGGPLLIIAGPGSGKTRVITRRIAWLVLERGVDPRRILAITFTNKAAREMRERVDKLIPERGAWIGTFHALGARILRREIETLGGWTRDFTIYDTGDRNQLLKSVIKDQGFDPARFRPAAVGGWISDWKNRGEGRESISEDDGLEQEVLRKVIVAYEAALEKANALDFDDLLLKVLDVFDAHPGIRDAWADRHQHVLVDEYQDTNRVQYRIAQHLASAHGNLAVCGDPDQSIYAWRGADIRNILDFERDWPAARVVKIEQNYRSTNTILRAAQAVIEKNGARKEKKLWSERGDGQRIVVLECADENDEACEIAERIRAYQSQGVGARQIAVFYRANFMQRALETQLRLARVPYQVIAGLEFFERREIRDLVAFAKLAVNPRDDVAFRRVANSPARGIGDKSFETLSRFAADRRISLFQAAQSPEALAQIRGKARSGIESFVGLVVELGNLRDEAARTALDAITDLIDYDAWIAEMSDEAGLDRDANVDELLAYAEEYDRRVEEQDELFDVATSASPELRDARDDLFAERADIAAALAPDARLAGGLRGFLQDIALVSDADGGEESVDKVSLMTLHAAKGLEFQVVFVAGVEEDLLPHARALISSSSPLVDQGLEEERRLFYVGLTRAMDHLVLTYCRARNHFGSWSARVSSRFLGEIPNELIEGGSSDPDEETMLGAYEAPPAIVELRVGDRVEHDHFGRGTIEMLQGSGLNARATVRFPAHGTKQLLLQYAKLRRIDGGAR